MDVLRVLTSFRPFKTTILVFQVIRWKTAIEQSRTVRIKQHLNGNLATIPAISKRVGCQARND